MEGTSMGALAVACVCIWNGMFSAIQSVCKERSIIKREHRAGLHISSYLAAHMIYQAILCLLQVLISLFVFKFFGGISLTKGAVTGSFWGDLFITMFLITFASDMLGLMVSCIAKNTTAAMTIMPFLLIVQLVFAGQVFPIRGRAAEAIGSLCISNWGIRTVCSVADANSMPSNVVSSALFSMTPQERGDLIDRLQDVMMLPEVYERVGYYTGSKLYEEKYEASKENIGKSWAVLASFAVAYTFVGLLFLENVDKDKR